MIRSTATALTLSALAIFLAACSTAKTSPKGGGGPDPAARATALSHEQAAARARQISHVTYNLWFGLDGTHGDYEGRAVINFELRSKAKEHGARIPLDFEDGIIRSLMLNGASVKLATDKGEPDIRRYDGHRIWFNVAELLPGVNRIELSFTHAYSHNGAGLHRFKDPVDGNVYLYSNFEPYDAHRMFPCFDQPDLKASYELTVEAPEDWQVVSNTPERDVATVDGRKSWQFPPSPIFSTYVFALHAGPYASWKEDADGIPIRLFARKSVAQYVDFKEWLEVTQQGLDYYGVQFGYPYPYAKYDQLIVPDFNAGAMENVGAVTFNESMIYRSKPTTDRRRGRASTILHEMAHMWFGDLVTMRWWNGLWLNESFATFMSAKAVDEATKFKGSWQDFFAGEKQWAYWEDQLVTTHPIEVPVPDTDQAEANFDGITYGKGASVLKQLNFLLSEDDFREGVQRYFQKYALRNTTVTEFVKMLSEASGQDLAAWQHKWLQTAGVNTLRAEWSCDNSVIRTFKLLQKAPEDHADLRPHRTEIALYLAPKSKAGKLRMIGKPFAITYSAAETDVPEAVGKECPDLVYPNSGDHDYAKVELDPVSLKTVTEHLAQTEDPFLRQMFWHDLWEMVIDGKLAADLYADAVLKQGAGETDTQVLRRILDSLVSPSAERDSVIKFLPADLRAEYRERFEDFARKHLQSAPAGSDLQLVWFAFNLKASRSEQAADYLHKLLFGKARLRGLKLDPKDNQERRWDIIEALARAGAPDARELIQTELKSDNTDMGQKAAIAAEAAIPDAASKKTWLDRILAAGQAGPNDHPEYNVAKLRQAMWNYHLVGQEDLTRPEAEPYFAIIPKLAGLPDEQFANRFAGSMFPALCDPSIVQRTEAVLAANPGLPAPVSKALRVGKQEEERCIRARAAVSRKPNPGAKLSARGF